MRSVVVIGFFIISALLTPDITHAGFNSEKREDIKRLLVLTDSGKMSVEVMKRVVFSYQQTAPEVPENFWERIGEEIEKDTYMDMLIPIYDKYLTHEDIKALLEFYSTDTGKKIIVVQPKIVKESIEAGEVWGDKISDIIKQKLSQAEEHKEK